MWKCLNLGYSDTENFKDITDYTQIFWFIQTWVLCCENLFHYLAITVTGKEKSKWPRVSPSKFPTCKESYSDWRSKGEGACASRLFPPLDPIGHSRERFVDPQSAEHTPLPRKCTTQHREIKCHRFPLKILPPVANNRIEKSTDSSEWRSYRVYP